jgi:hypothetical protein
LKSWVIPRVKKMSKIYLISIQGIPTNQSKKIKFRTIKPKRARLKQKNVKKLKIMMRSYNPKKIPQNIRLYL